MAKQLVPLGGRELSLLADFLESIDDTFFGRGLPTNQGAMESSDDYRICATVCLPSVACPDWLIRSAKYYTKSGEEPWHGLKIQLQPKATLATLRNMSDDKGLAAWLEISKAEALMTEGKIIKQRLWESVETDKKKWAAWKRGIRFDRGVSVACSSFLGVGGSFRVPAAMIPTSRFPSSSSVDDEVCMSKKK